MKISKNSGFNLSGLCRVKFCLTSKVKRISPPDSGRLVSVELKNNFDFDEIYFTPTTEDVSIEARKDQGYDVEVKLINPKLSEANAKTFSDLEQKDFIFLLTDQNESVMLVGSVESPARLTYKMNIPGAGRNQRTVVVDAIHDVEPFYVESTVTTAGGAFSDDFSEDFDI
jgi:hypothetical protein